MGPAFSNFNQNRPRPNFEEQREAEYKRDVVDCVQPVAPVDLDEERSLREELTVIVNVFDGFLK